MSLTAGAWEPLPRYWPLKCSTFSVMLMAGFWKETKSKKGISMKRKIKLKPVAYFPPLQPSTLGTQPSCPVLPPENIFGHLLPSLWRISLSVYMGDCRLPQETLNCSAAEQSYTESVHSAHGQWVDGAVWGCRGEYTHISDSVPELRGREASRNFDESYNEKKQYSIK